MKKAFGSLPATDCKDCLNVRRAAGKTILAAESSLSRTLGFTVGEDVSGKVPGQVVECEEIADISGAGAVTLRNQVGMTQEEFAKKYGISLSRLQKIESA